MSIGPAGPIDTATLGPVRVTPPGPREAAVLAVMGERGCTPRDGRACLGDCSCQRIVRLVMDALAPEAGARRFKADLERMGLSANGCEQLAALAMRRIGKGDLS